MLSIGCVQVEAEEFPELSLKYEVAAVPTFLFMKVSVYWQPSVHCFIFSPQGGKVVDRVNGAHVPELTKKTSKHAELLAPLPPAPTQTTPTEVPLARLTTAFQYYFTTTGYK